MKKRLLWTSVALWAALPASVTAQSTQTIAPSSGDSVILTDANLPQSADGKSITMTVNGVETPIAPGVYHGDVVLTTTDQIPITYKSLPTHYFRTALYVEDGVPVSGKSVTAAIARGTYGAGAADNVRITSKGEKFNGVLVNGTGAYTLNAPIIDLTGNGGNDFAGYGAAIATKGKATLTVNRPVIRTKGAVRTALFVGGDSVMTVNNAEIEVFNGTLPADYKFTIDVGRMMEVPWMLGLSGNVRAVNLVDNGVLYLNNSHVRAQGWGALSTDDAQRTRMYVKDSLIETTDAGYGTYSIGDSHNHFDNSIIRAADIGGIIAGEASMTFTNGTIVEAGLFGVMMHSGSGGGTLTIDKGSSVSSGSTAIQVKGRGTTIVVDGASLSAGNGIILQAMDNDDPFMKAMMRGEMPEGMSAPPPGAGGGGDLGPPMGGANFSPDVVATFRNTDLTGDIFNARPKDGHMSVRLESVTISGVISTSTAAPRLGKEPVRETYREIGQVVNTPAPVTGDKGLALSLDSKSVWTVTGVSYLTELTLEKGAVVQGKDGKPARITVNGKAVKKPGTYKGAIVVQP